MSKHSPTVVQSMLGGGTALAVPLHNDPLVLERTVNHVIYSHRGNVNKNGSEEGNSFLYDEAKQGKIFFPFSNEPQFDELPAEPSYTEPASLELASIEPVINTLTYSESVAAEAPLADPSPSPAPVLTATLSSQAQVEMPPTPVQPWEALAAAAMGGILDAAGATPVETPALVDIAAQHGSDDDSSPIARESAVQASASSDAASVSGDSGASFFQSVAQISSALQPASQPDSVLPPPTLTTSAAPSRGMSSNSTELSESEQRYTAPVVTSAQASSRPGVMDFFSATATAPALTASSDSEEDNNNSYSKESGDSGGNGGRRDSAASNGDVSVPAFTSDSHASIIQNAIQAAAALNNQTSSNVVSGNISNGIAERKSITEENDVRVKKSTKNPVKSASKKNPRLVSGQDDSEFSPAIVKSKLSGSVGEKANSSEKSKAIKRKQDGARKQLSKSGKFAEMTPKKKEKTVELMGFVLPLKFLKIAGVLLIFVGFPLMVLIANITSMIGGLSGSAGGAAGGGAAMVSTGSSGLSGSWIVAYTNPNGSVTQSSMSMVQHGSELDGFGVDRGPFHIKGTVSGSKVLFNKQYEQGGQAKDKPIIYEGKVDFLTENPSEAQKYYAHISGIWQVTKRVGYGWRAQIVQMNGKWEAGLTKRGGSENIDSSSGLQAPSSGVGVSGAGPVDPKKPQDFFMKVAFGIIAFGVVMAMVSLRFFGPSGLLNIWAKKKYIPSQFTSQHFKMVAEMGKPLRPGGVPLGSRVEWGIHEFWRPRLLNMPPDLREQNPHTLFLGGGAKGKSRLMASMIVNDIESADRAVIVVDSDGNLIDLVMNWIAAHPKGKQLAKRVMVIDPTHEGDTICYNPLEFPDDEDLQNAASSVVFGFKAVYTEPPGSQTQWNQQTANILRNTAVLLMANNRTLTDIPLLLSDNDFRDIMLETVEKVKSEKSEYTTLIDAWTNYKRLARTDQWINWIEPILNRIQPMLGDPRIRPILTKSKSDLNLQDIILGKKVLLVKIPQGQLDQNGNLLGALIVTGIKQAALSLSVRGKEKRRPVTLYLDEFDSFIEKETFDAITSETRKFQIGFCGASKTLQTLPEDYRNQLIINVGMMAIFALAKKDGDMLGPQMFRVDGRKVKHQTIQNVFNKVNTSPQFELISDEEKLNIDRVVGQEERTFFLYRVGTVAGVFHMKAPEFKDIDEKDINQDIIDQMYDNRFRKGDQDPDEE